MRMAGGLRARSVAKRRSLLNRVLLANWRSEIAVKRSSYYAPRVEQLESRQLMTGSIFGELRVQPAAPVE